MPRDPFEEFGRHLDRHLDNMPLHYPEALVKLIDAMRDYLRSNEMLGRELLHEEAITREQFEQGMREDAPLREWLKAHEEHELDPSLHGTIKEGGR
jgi:hypothetical protein